MVQICTSPSSNVKELCDKLISTWTQKETQMGVKKFVGSQAKAPVFSSVPYVPEPLRDGGRTLVMPVTGVESGYGAQYVACRVTKTHPDYMPLCCVCELMSQADGILYNAVRGPGYSYGVGIGFYPFNGYLAFTLSDSTAPEKALAAFVDTIRTLSKTTTTTTTTPKKKKGKGKGKCPVTTATTAFDELCTEAALETTKAIMLYGWYETKSTVPTIATSALKGYFRGFATPDAEERHHIRAVQAVTRADMRRVFDKYIRDFLVPEKVTTVFVTNPSACTRLMDALSQPPLSLKNVKKMKPSEITASIKLQLK